MATVRRGDEIGTLDERAEFAFIQKDNAELTMERDVFKLQFPSWSMTPWIW